MNTFYVSCQALCNEPLHSPFIMGRMAVAAVEGGADGIRANGVDDILEIKKMVDVPIIGIIKQNYEDSEVFITATINEVAKLVACNIEIIALDATNRIRPKNQSLEQLVNEIKKRYPNQQIMADCSTFEEMIYADKLGFDYIGTTLFGYTKYSVKPVIKLMSELKKITQQINATIIIEGQINTPEEAQKILELDKINHIVVGSAITRPQLITKKFSEVIHNE